MSQNIKILKTYLQTLDKPGLIALILQQTDFDDRLAERILVGAVKPEKHLDMAKYKKAIDQALDEELPGGFYGTGPGKLDLVKNVFASLRALLKKGYAIHVMELVEYFVAQLNRHIEPDTPYLDDSFFEYELYGKDEAVMDDLMKQAGKIHHTAARKAKPNPEHFARKLFRLQNQSGRTSAPFDDTAAYADVLGTRGMKILKELGKKKR